MIVSVATCLAVLVGAVAGHATTSKDDFDLKGEVYPNFKIELKTAAGRDVRTLKAGTYRIKVEDKSRIHDFHLTGPGVNRATSVAGTGERIWTVRLRPGKYTFMCDPHAGAMRGSFRVTA
jgi:plastocyanin